MHQSDAISQAKANSLSVLAQFSLFCCLLAANQYSRYSKLLSLGKSIDTIRPKAAGGGSFLNRDNVEGENWGLTAILSRFGVQVRAKCSAVSNVPVAASGSVCRVELL